MEVIPSQFSYTFSHEQIVFFQAFLRTYIKKMSDGEWKVQMEKFEQDFNEKYHYFKLDINKRFNELSDEKEQIF